MASTAGAHDAVRDHILDAVHRVIVAQGLAAASTRAIAEEASVGAGTIYNYFPDRVHLLAASMLRRAALLSAPLTNMPSRAGKATVADNLRRFVREIGDVLDQLVPLFAAAFSETDLLGAIRKAHASGWAPGPFAVHPIEGYLLAEQKLGRVASDADCHAAGSLIISLCHERAFLDHFLGAAGGHKSITTEIDFIARAVQPVAPAGRRARKPAPARRREQ